MKIEHRREGELGSFVALEGDQDGGELAYRIIEGNILTLDHTDVEPQFKARTSARN